MNNQLQAPLNRLECLGPLAGSISDEDAVRRVLAGDKAAFELLMRRCNQRLFRVVRSIVGDDGEAEDVVQQAYVLAFQNLAKFAGHARFATWLTKIGVNEAFLRKRRRKSMHVVDFRDPQNVSLEPRMANQSPDEQASIKELGTVLTKAVDDLPEDLRTVFTLRVIEEADTEETAECLGLSAANVKVRLHRARSLLRDHIDQQIGVSVRKVYQFDGERCDRIVISVLAQLAGRFGA